MKRLVLCCDGTWNTPDQSCADKPCHTNVTKLAAAIASTDAGTTQRVYYQRGVGTSPGERLRGGALGFGLSRGVQDVYRFVVDTYEPGDELFFFGFSRGAYMARSTAGLIRNAGILRRENVDRIGQAYALYRERAIRPRDLESRLFRRSFSHDNPRIRFLGVWDTVGALGIPWSGVPGVDRLNRPWQFHDTELSSIVEAAFQALAIDEARKPFEPAIWKQQPDAGNQVLEQVWFAGVHCDVGGGYPDSGLSDIALRWMADRARSCGLALQDGAFSTTSTGPNTPTGEPAPFSPDPFGTLHNSRRLFYRLLRPAPRTLGAQSRGHEYLASTAVERRSGDPSYTPENLVTFMNGPHQVMPV